MTESTIQTRETPIQTAEHDCPYDEARQSFLRHVAAGALAAYQLNGFERQLAEIHVDGVCPPTHIDRGPTRVWADWVQGLHR